MTGFEAFLLGLLQGLTEFLPVSSSGHLLIAKEFFGIETQDATFEIVVHAATVLSTIVVFRKSLWNMVSDSVRFRRTPHSLLALRILVSMIPVLVVGLFFKDKVEALFSGGITFVGFMLILTSLLLILAQWMTTRRNDKAHPIGYRDAFVIGIAQACAVVPGLSRSGATIAAGLCMGNYKDKVAPFSFMMVLVPVLGEAFLEILDGGFSPAVSGLSLTSLLIGFTTAFFAGLFACRFMIAIVRRVKFTWFALYCLLAGAACLIVPLFK